MQAGFKRFHRHIGFILGMSSKQSRGASFCRLSINKLLAGRAGHDSTVEAPNNRLSSYVRIDFTRKITFCPNTWPIRTVRSKTSMLLSELNSDFLNGQIFNGLQQLLLHHEFYGQGGLRHLLLCLQLNRQEKYEFHSRSLYPDP